MAGTFFRSITSLRMRLMLLVALALAPALALVFVTSLNASTQDRRAAQENVLDLARAASAHQNELVASGRQVLATLARVPEVRAGGAVCNSLLGDLIRQNPIYTEFSVIKPDGAVGCSSDPGLLTLNLADRPDVRRALTSADFAAAEATSGTSELSLAYPVIDADTDSARVQAVVRTELDVGAFRRITDTVHLPRGAALLLVGGSGAVLARYPDDQLAGKPAPAPLVDAIGLRGEGTVEAAGLDGVSRFFGFAALGPPGSGVFVAVGVPRDLIYNSADGTLRRNVLAILIVGVGAVAAAWVASQLFIIRRVRDLVRATRRIAAGDLAARVGAGPRSGELYHLSQAFDAMAATLQARQREAEQAEDVLRGREQWFRALIQHSSDLITVHEPEGTFLYVSPSVEAVLGYRAEDLAGRNPAEFIHPDDLETARYTFSRTLSRPDATMTMEVRFRHADSRWVHLEAFAKNRADDSLIGGIVLNSRDISERKHLEDKVRRQAFFDSLTGLPNRNLFMDRLQPALARAARRNSAVAILFLDLDGFKMVNDSLGHTAGDHLLESVARRLAACLRPGDTLARFGGDEFTVLVEEVEHPAHATSVAGRLLEALRAPFHVDAHELFVSASIGIGVTDARAETPKPDDLLCEADVALHRAKAAGKGCAVLFDASMNEGAIDRLNLQTDLQHAITRGELLLHYQPEVDLQTGLLVGMEALVRWEHPRLGLIGPAGFIPMAEETGLIVPLGRWVLEQACREAQQFAAVRTPGEPPLLMGVNLSPRQFARPEIVGEVAAILRDTGFDAANLRLEITETTAMQSADFTSRTLRGLKELGVRLAIDDFGTGYSSLGYLQNFAVDTLKIDQSFVSRLTDDPGAEAIVRAVTMLAHALGMDVTAEGIETADQLGRLRTLDCDRAQGYFFSRPVPAAAMRELLQRRPAGPAANRANPRGWLVVSP